MLEKLRGLAAKAAVVSLVACSLWAQRAARLVGTDGSPWAAQGPIRWQLDTSGDLTYMDMLSLNAFTAPTTITSPGGMHALSSTAALLCGRNAAGDGVVQRWQVSGGALVLLDEYALPGADFVGIAYEQSQQLLYALNFTAKTILVAPWDGVSSISTLSTSTIASQSAVPDLANATWRTIVGNGDGRIVLCRYPRARQLEGEVLDLSQGIVSVPVAGLAPYHDAYAVPVDSSEGDPLVSVKAPLGVPFEVVDVATDSVIGSGVGMGESTPVLVTTLAPLVLGERYVARVVGATTPADLSFECVRRYGYSEAFADGMQMEPFYYQRGATSGSVFDIRLNMHGPASPSLRAYSGYLLVAFRAPTDPVAQIGDNYLLQTGTYFPVSGYVLPDWVTGTIKTSIPIPDGLEGLVFLVQYYMMDGSTPRISQVYGASIR